MEHGRHRRQTLTWALPAVVLALLAALFALDQTGDEPSGVGVASVPPTAVQDISRPTTVDSGSAQLPTAPVPAALDAATAGAQRLGSLLRLHVIDTLGAPVGGVSLWLIPAGDQRRLAEVSPLLTDGNGWAELGGLAPGMITVLGRTDMQLSVDIPADTVVTRELVLRGSGESLRGRVVSSEGGPIAGARIWCSQSPNAIQLGGVVAMTDSDGSFEVAQASEAHLLAADAEGFIPSFKTPIEFLREAPGAEVQIVLEPGGFGLDVLVTDENDAPLPGVRVEAEDASYSSYVYDSPETTVTERLRRPVITDDHGRTRLEGLPELFAFFSIEAHRAGRRLGQRHIHFTADGTPMTLALPDSEVPLAGDPMVLEFSLSPEARFAGRVTNAQGDPVVHAVIRSLHLNAPYKVATDADGRFALRQLSGYGDMDVPVTLTHPGYAPLEVDLRLQRGETTHWNPVLERGVELTGTVVDSRGVPFAGAVLKAANDDWKGQVQTDASGAFHFGGIEGEQVTVSVFEDERAQASWPTLELIIDVPAEALEIELPRGLVSGRVTGTVVDPAGVTLKGKISIQLVIDGALASASFHSSTGRVIRREVFPAGSREFVVDRLAAGSYGALIEVEGRPDLRLFFDYPDISVDHDLGTLVMPAGGTLTVTPNVIAGVPSKNRVIFVLRTLSGDHVDGQGVPVGESRSFNELAGDYRLFVVDKEMVGRSQIVTLHEGEHAELVVDVQAAPTIYLQGDKPAEPFEQPLTVRVRDSNGALLKTYSWTGRSRLRMPMLLLPGPYELSIGDDGAWTTFHAAVNEQVVRVEP